jgi:hypothetical protein
MSETRGDPVISKDPRDEEDPDDRRQIMVPLGSERRHRLQPEEVPAVMRAVQLRLQELCVDHVDVEEAWALFRVLFRFVEHRPGVPAYPPLSWETFSGLANGTIVGVEAARR